MTEYHQQQTLKPKKKNYLMNLKQNRSEKYLSSWNMGKNR